MSRPHLRTCRGSFKLGTNLDVSLHMSTFPCASVSLEKVPFVKFSTVRHSSTVSTRTAIWSSRHKHVADAYSGSDSAATVSAFSSTTTEEEHMNPNIASFQASSHRRVVQNRRRHLGSLSVRDFEVLLWLPPWPYHCSPLLFQTIPAIVCHISRGELTTGCFISASWHPRAAEQSWRCLYMLGSKAIGFVPDLALLVLVLSFGLLSVLISKQPVLTLV
ncbi:hypothetical protein BV25DRAFT_487323 [Artomyces pyxidatus]|uniref:Uncharacterized protein n=1 Tax=Artomyces pyxidatus TaxID=48021 RepID=A0ACB8T3Z5_9AGAM|nr:hypothetical protein BV25DRAFT_487323 [Artomyces pyxidatus]